MGAVPVWVWLPGGVEPVQAGELVGVGPGARFAYLPQYLGRSDAVALDPVELRLTRKKRGTVLAASDGLPGVVRDAKPAGYGADRLEAQAGRTLTALELLERGVPDGVGAIEVCADIEAKLAWQPKALDQLQSLAQELDAAAPASRALRRLDEDLDTSAGGERPACAARTRVRRHAAGADGRAVGGRGGTAHLRRTPGAAGRAVRPGG
jgi:serine/threonine-protein kinase HipA